MKKQAKSIIPAFATEAEEADWWYKNREIHGMQLLAAANSGEARTLTSVRTTCELPVEATFSALGLHVRVELFHCRMLNNHAERPAALRHCVVRRAFLAGRTDAAGIGCRTD
jgi:hypothetical protein